MGDAADMHAPDLVVTGRLRRFEEVRDGGTWFAVCEVRLELREARSPQLLWAETLSARRALAQQDRPALAAAMSEAVAEVVVHAAEAMGESAARR